MHFPVKSTQAGKNSVTLNKYPKAAELLARVLQELNIHRLKGGEACVVDGVIPDEVMLILEQAGVENEDLELEFD